MTATEINEKVLLDYLYLDRAKLVTYLILPGRKHGSYEYPDLLVSMEKSLLGKPDHFKRRELLWGEDHSVMLSLRQFVDFLNLLKSGRAYYGNGKSADKMILNAMFEDITSAREPIRAEWLGDIYQLEDYQSKDVTREVFDGENLNSVTEPLEECLMENKPVGTIGIDLEDWLRNANSHGLPRKGVGKGDLYYFRPEFRCAPKLVASSSGLVLHCNEDIRYCSPWDGVRKAKIFEA